MFEGNTISLNICNTLFKETKLPSIWTGTPFTWRKGFTHHKKNCTLPKASWLKGQLHIPKEYLRMFSIQYFFDYGLWRMHLIDTWCLRGQMNQIWLGLILNKPNKNKKNNHQRTKRNVLGDTLWDGGRGEGSPMHCFFVVFWCLCFFWQIANSRWLTLQWNSQWNRPMGRSWWGGNIYIYK